MIRSLLRLFASLAVLGIASCGKPASESAPAGSATPAAVGVDKRCKVPNLKGLTRTGARKRLAGAGCAIGKVRGRSGGRVKSQTKKAGTNVAAGTKVGITLAKKTKAKKRAKR